MDRAEPGAGKGLHKRTEGQPRVLPQAQALQALVLPQAPALGLGLGARALGWGLGLGVEG
jgi:hypothetical protein